MSIPTQIAIDHDDYHAQHVGRTADGRQFFLTTPFEPGGSEYVALFLFDAGGRLLEALVDDLGTRESMDEEAARATVRRRLDDLGPVEHGRIDVAPFAVERFGTLFGLVPQTLPGGSADDAEVTVEMQPGNYMAFFEPWDSGDYDT